MFGKSAPDPSPLADVIDVDDEATMRRMADDSKRRSHEMHRCRHCRYLFDPAEESAILRKRWCHVCESNWLDAKLNALVDRFGRKAALAAFRRLTR